MKCPIQELEEIIPQYKLAILRSVYNDDYQLIVKEVEDKIASLIDELRERTWQ